MTLQCLRWQETRPDPEWGVVKDLDLKNTGMDPTLYNQIEVNMTF